LRDDHIRHYLQFPEAIPDFSAGYPSIPHPFAAFTSKQASKITLDLHASSTPPAFVLSQDQTLHKKFIEKFACSIYTEPQIHQLGSHKLHKSHHF